MRILLSVSFILFFVSLHSQTDGITGIWLTEDKQAKVEIHKRTDGMYNGRIVWLKEPKDESGKPFTDTENPEKSKRGRPLIDMEILYDFVYDRDAKVYISGKVYDSRDGKTYKGKIWMKSADTLMMRGYWGIFYETETWTRVKNY